MTHYDELFKHLGEYSPEKLASAALSAEQVIVMDSLNTEQPTVKLHQSDLTFRVLLPDRGEEAILHIEAQTEESRDKPMPLRMLSYASHLVHQHEMNVYSTVFYLRPPAGQNDPGHYTYGDEVIGGLRFTYNVVRVYELEGESYLDPGNIGLLAFTPLMRPPTGTTSKEWVDKCIETTMAAPVDSRTRGTLLYALSVFGGLIHPSEYFVDGTLEAIVSESPIYETVIQRGIQQGLEQGLEKGLEQGLEQGLVQGKVEGLEEGLEKGLEQGLEKGRINEKRTDVLKIVRYRFAEQSDTVLNEITAIDDLGYLDELFDQVLTAETFEDIDFSKNGK